MGEQEIKSDENRDLRTTILDLGNGDWVQVNPIDLFENSLENYSEEIFEKFEHFKHDNGL